MEMTQVGLMEEPVVVYSTLRRPLYYDFPVSGWSQSAPVTINSPTTPAAWYRGRMRLRTEAFIHNQQAYFRQDYSAEYE